MSIFLRSFPSAISRSLRLLAPMWSSFACYLVSCASDQSPPRELTPLPLAQPSAPARPLARSCRRPVPRSLLCLPAFCVQHKREKENSMFTCVLRTAEERRKKNVCVQRKKKKQEEASIVPCCLCSAYSARKKKASSCRKIFLPFPFTKIIPYLDLWHQHDIAMMQ